MALHLVDTIKMREQLYESDDPYSRAIKAGNVRRAWLCLVHGEATPDVRDRVVGDTLDDVFQLF